MFPFFAPNVCINLYSYFQKLLKNRCNCGLTHCVRDWGLSELFGAQRTDSVQDDVRVSDYRE